MPTPDRTIEERLEEYKWIEPNGCWRWLASVTTQGRPQVWYEGRYVLVTRLIMHLNKGFDLDSPLLVCHNDKVCNQRECWNPDHLYVGTDKDNMRDRVAKITHCPKGHEYDEANTRIKVRYRYGRRCTERACIACEKLRYK
jgi:hypothetical protein